MSRFQKSGPRAWIISLAWLAGVLLYAGLAMAPVRFPFVDTVIWAPVTLDEVLHFLAFAWLALAFPLAFSSRLLVVLAPLMLVLLGIVSEFMQMHIPMRRFSEIDVLANTLGCIVGTLLGFLLRFLLHRRSATRGSAGQGEG